MKFKITLAFLFSISLLFSQGKEKFNYKLEATKGTLNFFQIVAKKNEEIKNYDLSKLSALKEKKHFYRWAHFWKDRVDANGNFPPALLGYYNAGILDEKGKIVLNSNTRSKSSVSSENWVNVGPQSLPEPNGYSNPPQMGRLNCFLRFKHPSDRNQDVLFVGAPNGGVWKSVDGGLTWAPKLDIVAGIGVTDIKSTPDATYANYTSKPIYVSTGDYDGNQVTSIGVLKSTDGGETFASTGLSYTLNQEQLLGKLIVADENTVLVGARFALKKTTDGGTTWTDAFSPNYSPAGYGRVAISGTKAMITGYFEIIYTDDFINGTWTSIEFTGSYNPHAITTGEDGEFYVQDNQGQIRKFDTGTKTFENYGTVTPGYDSQGGFNQTLLVKNDVIISGEVNGSSTINSGNSWYKSLNGYWNDNTSDGTYIHSDHHGMGFLDGAYEFWSVNDGGLSYVDYGSDPGNQKPTITYKSEKVIVTQSYSVAINPTANDDAYVLSNQDNDSFSKVNGNWVSVAMGDGIQSAINYNNPNIRYAANQNGFLVETDTGFENQLQGNGKSVTVPGANFYFPLEMHKTDPTILFAGGDEVYQIKSDFILTITNLNSGAGQIEDIATHGNSLLVSGDTGLKFSSDNGANWSNITPPAGTANSVDFDATNNNIMYVTVSGYSSGLKVFKSTDGGANFTNISGDLPNIVMKEIMLKQNQGSEYLFLATELGVYYTKNGGTNWIKLGNGLPNVDVRDIEIHYTNDRLVAATFGRGLWEINIANTTLSTDDFSPIKEGISVYPNPTKNGLLNVKISNTNQYNYLIYNVIGGVVQRGKVTANQPINISSLSNNMYVLRVFNDNESFTSKFIKTNN